VMLLLTLYVCCSSVVCCEAGRSSTMQSSSLEKENTVNGCYGDQTFDDDITPVHLISIRVTELL
ncbi:MAG: hypothetical protein ABI861_09525, partial [Panacibacter sp.]